MILRLGDGSLDRFWRIVGELETDILNCFLDGLQDFLMDFRELGPTQHANQHRSFWWILFQIETSSFQTFRCLNWNGIIWAGPPLFHTSPDTSGVSVVGAKRVWPELCVNRRSGCTWRRAWRFGSRRKRNMLVRRPKRTFWVLWIVLGTIGFQFSACNSLRLGMSIPKNLSRKTRTEQEKSSALTNPNPL